MTRLSKNLIDARMRIPPPRPAGGRSQPSALATMHPPLAPHLHGDKCKKIIERLKLCHEEQRWGKFLGRCNELKRELDRCLHEERMEKCKLSQQQAVERKKRYRERELLEKEG